MCQRLRVVSGEKNFYIRPKNFYNPLISAKQSKNAMMSSISPSEEQTGWKAKKSWKSLYDERMASLQTEGLSSSYDHPERTVKTVTAIMANTAEQTLARTPVGTNLATTWIRGGPVRIVARRTTMFPRVLLTNRT